MTASVADRSWTRGAPPVVVSSRPNRPGVRPSGPSATAHLSGDGDPGRLIGSSTRRPAGRHGIDQIDGLVPTDTYAHGAVGTHGDRRVGEVTGQRDADKCPLVVGHLPPPPEQIGAEGLSAVAGSVTDP